MDYSKIRGFNYQPSFGSSGFEIWQNFDASTVDIELGRGKKYFPKMNAIRLWLSWDSFIRDPQLLRRVWIVLAIAEKYELLVMPVLFNRWHDLTLDWGGVYLDHFYPAEKLGVFEKRATEYMEKVVGGHAGDERIFAWDLCNEPQMRKGQPAEARQAEFTWLQHLYEWCKSLGAEAAVTVGIIPQEGRRGIEEIEPISDVLSIHPYYIKGHPQLSQGKFEELLNTYVDFAAQAGKPLVATETCWGSLDDQKRVEIIRYTLDELNKREIGYLVYLLHHSLIADAHGPGYGPVGGPENLAFINPDGSLRPGHEIFNEDADITRIDIFLKQF